MRFFDAVVTPCVLYGSGSWTMTQQREATLRTAQRRMLRAIVQIPRYQEEDWVNYIQRATSLAEARSTAAGVESWIQTQRRRKWRWAGHIARLEDRRWTQLMYWWSPTTSRRRVGRPCRRWEEAFEEYFKNEPEAWHKVAADRARWKSLEEAFCRK